MWIKFCISLLMFGLIHQVKCIDTPYSDMYLPDRTNGFLCQKDLIAIDHVRDIAKKAFKSLFFDHRFQRFPKLFEDTHLFNVRTDIFFSWPAKPDGKLYIRNPGKLRLIINIRGQIMGMVIINSKQHNSQVSIEKCKPVRSSNTEGNNESRILDEYWSLACPILGYKCGLKYIPKSMIKSGDDSDSNYYFQNALEANIRPDTFEKYSGN
ncbi:BgTH12-06927 [Blumeria graminis f. sp. triticale]|uniref:BgTH12-06927 n=1 Tax=Blumeria graminis f. sp. triticale TaxID=1689686 RepID=A0A9W4DDU5_BLUGR|nr:BgTH12-06927 [Blumeria graminis f. sp. triticale]